MVKNKLLIFACAGLLLFGCFFYAVFPVLSGGGPGQNSDGGTISTFSAPYGKLIIRTNISDLPRNMTLYRVTSRDNDMIDYWNWDPVNKNGTVPSESEAPQIVKKFLDMNGGLPEGAGQIQVETEYLEEINGLGMIVRRIPDSTVVKYQRSLEGMPVIGGFIRLELGKNGELLNLKKVWRTVTPAGTTQVISEKEALKKILGGDVLNAQPKCVCDLTVNNVQLAYMENDYNESQDYLNPVWVFKGTLSSGEKYSYLVSALNSTTPFYPMYERDSPLKTDKYLNNSSIAADEKNITD